MSASPPSRCLVYAYSRLGINIWCLLLRYTLIVLWQSEVRRMLYHIIVLDFAC